MSMGSLSATLWSAAVLVIVDGRLFRDGRRDRLPVLLGEWFELGPHAAQAMPSEHLPISAPSSSS